MEGQDENYFLLLSGQRYELDGVTSETTLREVKRFLESKQPSFTRESYCLSIEGHTSASNVNSLMKFSDYLRSEHGLDFNEDSTLTVKPLRYSHGVQFFSKHYPRTIPSEIEESVASNPAIDLLTLELIRGLPVKINGKFYDFDAFSTYLADQKEKYIQKMAAGQEYIPVCPIRIPLPEVLQKSIIESIERDEIDPLPSPRKHPPTDGLRSFVQLEEYEDLLASISPLAPPTTK